jgi:protein O-GlcNAc transferase
VLSHRLIFAPRVSSPLHLARHLAADLFLDTLPYNAHTTASDALWAGLPVLTCTGRSFAARVAASLLNAVELPELVTDTLTQYEDRAIQLAQDASELAELKKGLAANRLSRSLINTKLFARHVETAYQTVCDRYRGGLAPEEIFIG